MSLSTWHVDYHNELVRGPEASVTVAPRLLTVTCARYQCPDLPSFSEIHTAVPQSFHASRCADMALLVRQEYDRIRNLTSLAPQLGYSRQCKALGCDGHPLSGAPLCKYAYQKLSALCSLLAAVTSRPHLTAALRLWHLIKISEPLDGKNLT